MNIIEAITPTKAKTEITIVGIIRENYVLIFIKVNIIILVKNKISHPMDG